MRIALDAMGTDMRPQPDVAGGILYARETNDTVLLVGDESCIQRELQKYDLQGLNIEVIHAPDEILMSDKPGEVLKSKPESSLHVGSQLVKDSEADAFVTMGNTGAIHAIATLGTLRRIAGVRRPALSMIYPMRGRNLVLLDMGANADARPEWMVQFAMMGSIYARTALGYANPRIATLSNGEEDGKGNQLVRETQMQLMELDLNYIGHIEPAEILLSRAEVIVFDGFVGNIFLKTVEGTIRYMTETIREELMADPVSRLGALFARNAFRRTRNRLNPDNIGGAPLLGINGVVVVGHGSSSPEAIRSSMHQARRTVQGKTVEAIRDGLRETRR